MDLTAIQAAVSRLKAATDISKSFLEMKSISEVQSKVIDIQSALLSAQSSAISATSAQFELQEKVRNLETQLKSMDDWGSQKKRYALVSPWQGPLLAYALKQSSAEGEAPHLVCTNCFHNSKSVILNPIKIDGWVSLVCPTCKATMGTGYRAIGSPKYAEEYPEKG